MKLRDAMRETWYEYDLTKKKLRGFLGFLARGFVILTPLLGMVGLFAGIQLASGPILIPMVIGVFVLLVFWFSFWMDFWFTVFRKMRREP